MDIVRRKLMLVTIGLKGLTRSLACIILYIEQHQLLRPPVTPTFITGLKQQLTFYNQSKICSGFQYFFNIYLPSLKKDNAISVMPTLLLLAGDLRFFASSPALVHKSPAFYVHYKY